MEENRNLQEEPKPPFDMETFKYFSRIIRTVFFGFFLLIFDAFVGLYLGFGDPTYSTPLLMTIFYIWFIASMGVYLYFVYKMWSKKVPHP
ncbi:hypothetical protein LX64_03704 [Chitinophaga skermanii]|uniref:2TM domain-containing protein n=1 Tax=Chitinophaga skermanii TaxID=331697 RepID=A0A327QAC1_9BACT|nr:hypothetical protein [Chitinophaga skermanii]RAJ01489.1 hypothetical protein LX64_03704 [Chitinophaga skermanii]